MFRSIGTHVVNGVAVLLLPAAGLGFIGAPSVQADCLVPSTPRAADRSDAVFVGTTLGPVEGEDNTFEVRASDVYKGSPGAFLDVDGADYETGIVLKSHQQYLFFVTKADGSWRVLACGPTQPISSRVIAQTARVLGGPATPLRAPATPGSGPSESPNVTPDTGSAASEPAAADADDSRTWLWVGAGVALLAGAGVVAAATRRRRS